MTQASSNSKGFGKVASGIFSLVLLGSMVLLTLTLYGECTAGRETVDDYIAAVKRGSDVSTQVAGDEAPRLTALLRGSTSMKVDNFQSQANTSCYWITVKHGTGETELTFVLKEREKGVEVIAASISRACECPDPDFEKPCHLK